MPRLSLLTWIGNAAAVLCGKHGEVTAAASAAGCSRQSAYDHADKVHQALEDARLPGPCRARLLEENRCLRQENQQLWDWLEHTIDFPPAKQQQFATTASGMGISLSQILVLLALLLPEADRPSRATLGRWVQRSARRAGKLLRVLDKACRGLVLALCLDEIFVHRKPILMAVEPASLAWVLGQRSADRSGDTWAKALAEWPQLRKVAADGGTGIERGLQVIRSQRQQAAQQPGGEPALPLQGQLDVFHLRRDGARALRQEWAHAQECWEKAEAVERAKGRHDRKGGDGRKFNQAKVDKAWAQAVAAFEAACAKERAWARAAAALQLFRPDGQLNDREWAEGELRAAAAELTGSRWAKVVRQLQDPRALTFLDGLHEELSEAEPQKERREALVALWQWRRQQRRAAKASGGSAAGQEMGALVAGLVQARLGPGWEESYRQVSRVLKGVLRASSAVEGVNSVVRMHQGRHRSLSQNLLDLKRLFWNTHGFLEGKRKGRCPYQLLGLLLPSYDPWQLLQMDPAQLGQLLSSPELAA
jgi:hypothetical protein